MSLIDRYVFREWLIGFALTLGVVIGILVLQNIYDTLPDLLDANARPESIIFYYVLVLPTYLPAILPITLLVSLLFTLGALHRNNEIVALRASGVSLFRMSRSLWVSGLALSGLLLYLTAFFVPHSVEKSRTFLNNLEFAAEESGKAVRDVGLLYNLGFDNRKERRLWFMNRFSERAWLGLGVNVHTHDEEGRESQRIAAKEAYFDDINGYWVFKEGRELLIDPASGDPLRLVAFEEKIFEDFSEDPNLMLALHKKPKELSLFELKRVINQVQPEENQSVYAYRMRYLSLFATPFSCLVIVGISVPFAVSGVRTNPMIGLSKAISFFGLFYVLISLASILGERQIIPALFAAWIPNLVMLGMSVYFFIRVR